MDRLQFISNTFHDDQMLTLNDIISFFDHTMVAYNVLGTFKKISLYGITDYSHSSIRVKIVDLDTRDMVELEAFINNVLHNHMEIYDHVFNIYLNSNEEYELYIQKEK